MATASKTNQAELAADLVAGIKKHYPNAGQTLTFGGATYAVTALTAQLQALVDNRQAVDDARAALKVKVAAERAQAPQLMAVKDAFVKFVRGTFGTAADSLADFGLSPPKARTPLTATEKAAAAAKRTATRAARGTMGKNQKKGVKGNVTATLVVTPGPTAKADGAGSSGTSGAAGPTGPNGGASSPSATNATTPTAASASATARPATA